MNKKLLVRVGVCIVDTVLFFSLATIIFYLFPSMGFFTSFIILSVVYSIIEKFPWGKGSMGDRLFGLKRDKLDFDLSTNIHFYEIPLRYASFILPVVFLIRVFWVKETEYGWIDKAVESRISYKKNHSVI